MVTLSFEPLVRPALWVALALAMAGLVAWYGTNRPWSLSRRRWAAILALAAAGGAVPLVILLNPTWHERIPPPAGKPRLTVVVDASASMAAADAGGGRTRYQAASEIARAFHDQLTDRFDIHIATFSGSLSATDIERLAGRAADGQLTDLATAIAGGLQQGPEGTSALVLLSDGIHNAGGGTARVLAAVAIARATATPIYTRVLGGDTQIRDLAVRLRSPQQLAFVGQNVPVAVHVTQRGVALGEVTVVLEHDGHQVGRRRTALAADGQAEVRFQVRKDTRGLYRYEARVEPFAGEVTQVNNYGTFLLRVVDEPIRVLVVEGKPYWDAKFLMRTLVSDPSIELVSVVRLAQSRLLERTLSRPKPNRPAGLPAPSGQTGKAAPPEPGTTTPPPEAPLVETWKILSDPAQVLAGAAALGSYQVLVLGRDAEIYLTDEALENLRAWVSRDSGSLVCYRGQPMSQVNERLGRLLPIAWSPARESRFRVRLTDRGQDLRWLEGAGGEVPGEVLARLPTLASTALADEPKPLATVLADAVSEGDEQGPPVVTYQPYGGGRVVVVEGAGMWRWAFLPPKYGQHDQVYSALWQSLLRWLVSHAGLLPGQKLALRTDKVSFGTAEPATATLLVRDESGRGPLPAVELTGGGLDRARTFVPVASGDEPGVFRVVFGQLPEGRYQARVAGEPSGQATAETAFDVRRLMEEELDLKARPDLLARIATSTGGAVLEEAGPGEIADQFARHVARSRPERIRRLSAWDRWWVLAGAIGVWAAAWGVRRSGGLV